MNNTPKRLPLLESPDEIYYKGKRYDWLDGSRPFMYVSDMPYDDLDMGKHPLFVMGKVDTSHNDLRSDVKVFGI